MPVTLILGGARSGKSRHAERLALEHAASAGGQPIMIATAEALDDEMAARIARHRADRSSAWRTIEAPLDLVRVLAGLEAGHVAVVDCLTLWLSNLMLRDANLEATSRELLAALSCSTAEIILVSNEVGFGIVPDNALARRFRDEAGRLNQQIAGVAETVLLVVAGLPLTVKSPGMA